MTCDVCSGELDGGETQTYRVHREEDDDGAVLCDVYCLEDWIHHRLHEGPGHV